MEGATLPLNQGDFGTCVGHAFTQALTTAIQEKFGVPCDPVLVVEKIKVLCECWDGHSTDRMPVEWNEVHAEPKAAIEDMDKRRRYNVRVDCRRIDDFAAARIEMLRAEHLRTMMPCAITTDAAGHPRHSVALYACVPSREDKMIALNSWGAQDTHMDVTPSNFQYAMTFEPTIVSVHEGSEEIAVPSVQEVYAQRESEFADRKQEHLQQQREVERLREELRRAERREAEARQQLQKLVADKEHVVSEGSVPPPSIVVEGAGTDNFNGIYEPSGMLRGKTKYLRCRGPGNVPIYKRGETLEWEKGKWVLKLHVPYYSSSPGTMPVQDILSSPVYPGCNPGLAWKVTGDKATNSRHGGKKPSPTVRALPEGTPPCQDWSPFPSCVNSR